MDDTLNDVKGTKPKNKGGRPKKDIDQATFERLLKMGERLKYIAAFFGVHEDTVQNWIKRTYGKTDGKDTTFEAIRNRFLISDDGIRMKVRKNMLAISDKGNYLATAYLYDRYIPEDAPEPQQKQVEVVMPVSHEAEEINEFIKARTAQSSV